MRRKDVKDTALDVGVQMRRTRPKVSMSCVRVMEGSGGSRKRKRTWQKSRKGEAKLAQMSLGKVFIPYPGAEQTYLQRLNKTSLCQTIQGMAGHSLCGVEG